MKQLLLIIGSVLLLSCAAQAQTQPRKCGIQEFKEQLIAKDPSWAERFNEQRAAMQGIADDYIAKIKSGAAERTTTVSAVPIVFHIIVDSAQFNALGGIVGITKRCDSQIAVLNRDYNMQNPDSTKIPSLWKPLYGNVGIKFGLARIDPSGNCSPGYEVKIISGSSTTDAGFSNEDNAFPEAKTASTGLAAWDVTKYYNVWCINFTGAAVGLLGLTQPRSFCTPSTLNQMGVCMLYTTLGCTAASGAIPTGTGTWPFPYNLGRTLTHETGHFFEIWHPWGDDNGRCPTWSSTATVNGITCTAGSGDDDGLSDTPPESDAVYGNPTYNVTNGTETDCCNMHGTTDEQPIGIACLSYMDYTDDDAMHLFTPMQAAVMASMVLVPATGVASPTGKGGTVGENYTLTQNPSLLIACSTASVATTEVNNEVNIFPNPSNGEITITLNAASEPLKQIVVLNLVGQQVMTVTGQGKDYYILNLAAMSKGVYFVKCNFVSGSVTKKVVLQ